MDDSKRRELARLLLRKCESSKIRIEKALGADDWPVILAAAYRIGAVAADLASAIEWRDRDGPIGPQGRER